MNIFLAIIIFLNSFMALAARSNSDMQCETPSELMASKIIGKDFTALCNKIIASDPGCKKLVPEKRMNCSTKSSNNILSSNDLSSRIGQCIKGFAWDSMVDIAKFVMGIIKTLINVQVNSTVGILRFLGDSEYREKMIAAAEHGAGTGFKLAKAFLNSTSLYFAREFPRNLKNHPFNPMMALGETLMKPLMNFITDSVQQIAAHYIPQFQCMNGVAKLYTVCRTFGDFIMPPVILLNFLKYGVRGLKLMKDGAEAAKIARVKTLFTEANEIHKSAKTTSKLDQKSTRIALDHSPKKTPPKTVKKAADAHPETPSPATSLTKPIEEYSPDELIELARSEQAEARVVTGGLSVSTVPFSVSGSSYLRITPMKPSSPRLRELLDFAHDNRIVLVKDVAPESTAVTNYVKISSEALTSEKTFIDQLESSIKNYVDAPLNIEKLPKASQKSVQKMKENFQTKFINEAEDQGASHIYQNKIGIKLRHPDNLRVNAIVNHEITHNTTDRHIFAAFNSDKSLTAALAGREMRFRSKAGKQMPLPNEISGYNRFYRSDEIEAVLKEMAKAKHDGLSTDMNRKQILSFIDSQKSQIHALIKNSGKEFKITVEAIEPALGSGRRQRRVVTTPEANFSTEILVPRGLKLHEEREFIMKTFQERLKTIDDYRKRIEKKFPELEFTGTSAP
jgi:hypothetical protein